MTSILAYLPSLGLKGAGTPHLDDDLMDRWNHQATTTVFIVLAVLISTLQHFGDPLHCIVPGTFNGNYEKYTDHICWISNTYRLPQRGEPIPTEKPEDLQINYYQWVSLFLIIQALFFYLPCVVWRAMHPRCGLDINSINTTASQICRYDKSTEHKAAIGYIVQQLDGALDHYNNGDREQGTIKGAIKMIGKVRGNFLVFLYIMIKCSYVLNAIFQLFILNWFLSTNFHFYGIDVVRSWIEEEVYPTSKLFPHSTLCSFEIRAMGNVHRHTVQCVLPINFYNEKLYLIVWFWLFASIILNIISLFTWLYRFFLPKNSYNFIRHFLRTSGQVPLERSKNDRQKEITKGFVRDYLRHDGVFALRLLKLNGNGLVVSQVVRELYKVYEAERKPIAVNGNCAAANEMTQV